jgi:penicillin-binding protein 2
MTDKPENQRINVLGILVAMVFVILTSQLVNLQLVHGNHYKQLANDNRIRLIRIMAPRGNFYDRNGIPLVTNRPGFSVSLVPMSGPVKAAEINKLAEILQMPAKAIRSKIGRQDGSFTPITLKSDVGPDVVTEIEEQHSELPGVDVETQPVRDYIHNDLGAHMFGYVGEISEDELKRKKAEGYKENDIVGKFGLEEVYDKELRGVDGGEQVEVDADGRPVKVLGIKEPVMGDSLVLTIDYRIQRAAEKAMDEQLPYLQKVMGNVDAKAAAAVVMNPQTGAILAMVSRPAFNPNLFNGGISEKNWKIINDNPHDPMENRAISGEYPPGSTFKIITSTAAFELKKLSPTEKIYDSGHYMGKQNAMGESFGWIDYATALAKSDDVYFYHVGQRVGIDNLAKYARMYGLGVRTGIKLPGEASGLVASREYKEKVYHEPWYISETLDAAIGQGFQLETPLQMAMVMSEVANGGIRYRPYLVSEILSPDKKVIKRFGPKVIGHVKAAKSTFTLIRNALHDVSLPGGTAGYAFDGFPIPIAAKTGTAQNSHGDDNGLFVVYAPFDHPRIAVAVVVEHGGFGSDSAAPIARKILDAAFNLNQPDDSHLKVYRQDTAV